MAITKLYKDFILQTRSAKLTKSCPSAGLPVTQNFLQEPVITIIDGYSSNSSTVKPVF